jgi:putative heme transporter
VSSGRASRAKLLGSLLLAAAIFAFLFRRVDVAGVRAEIQEMTWLELATVALIAGWNQVTYWLLWMAVTPGLGWAQAMTLTQAGTAVTNTVPGGSGIGVGLAYAMLDSWGFSRARSTLAVLVTGVWNTFIKLALPVLALALIALEGDASRSRVAAGRPPSSCWASPLAASGWCCAATGRRRGPASWPRGPPTAPAGWSGGHRCRAGRGPRPGSGRGPGTCW